eukprot:SAG11_NODE_16306_length_551_cov_1.030973_1_plen_176_part_01
MVSHFDAAKVVEWAKKYDPTRLVDTNSGGAGEQPARGGRQRHPLLPLAGLPQAIRHASGHDWRIRGHRRLPCWTHVDPEGLPHVLARRHRGGGSCDLREYDPENCGGTRRRELQCLHAGISHLTRSSTSQYSCWCPATCSSLTHGESVSRRRRIWRMSATGSSTMTASTSSPLPRR